jgi:hypothetical protein
MTLQATARNIQGSISRVDPDNKVWMDQTKPKLEHPVGYFIRGDELIARIRTLEGQTANLVIGPDRVKKDKTDDGNYGSYWWSVLSEGAIDVQAPPKPDPQPDPNDVETPSKPYPNPNQTGGLREIPPNPAALGACHNHAVDFIARGILPVPMGRELFGWIRELRDRFYREINQAPVMPLHYCYEHGEERRQGNEGGWGHQMEPKDGSVEKQAGEPDAYCIEGREAVAVAVLGTGG